MAGLLNDSKSAICGSDEFVGGEMGGGKWMRHGSFKAVMVPEPSGTGNWQLFDVTEDPGEAKDLAKAMPDKLSTLQAAWDRYAKDVGVILSE